LNVAVGPFFFLGLLLIAAPLYSRFRVNPGSAAVAKNYSDPRILRNYIDLLRLRGVTKRGARDIPRLVVARAPPTPSHEGKADVAAAEGRDRNRR